MKWKCKKEKEKRGNRAVHSDRKRKEEKEATCARIGGGGKKKGRSGDTFFSSFSLQTLRRKCLPRKGKDDLVYVRRRGDGKEKKYQAESTGEARRGEGNGELFLKRFSGRLKSSSCRERKDFFTLLLLRQIGEREEKEGGKKKKG